MKPLTLADASGHGGVYQSADQPFVGGLYYALKKRGACAAIYGDPFPDWDAVEAFNARYKGAPVGFVIARVNRALEGLGNG